MVPRAYWKGYLKLSLVSCPIALYPATSEREKISFHQLNRETGNRIRYRKVDAETGDDVEQANIIKGYELAKGEYVDVTREELEAVAIESKRTIEIEQFVPKTQIDELYIHDPYYIAPNSRAAFHAALRICRQRVGRNLTLRRCGCREELLLQASAVTRVAQPASTSANVAKLAIVGVWLLLSGPWIASPQPPAKDNAWLTSYGGQSITVFDKNGKPLTPPDGITFNGQLGLMQGVIVTPSTDVWVLGVSKSQLVYFPKGDLSKGSRAGESP